jgi:uncharacterized protein YkwD
MLYASFFGCASPEPAPALPVEPHTGFIPKPLIVYPQDVSPDDMRFLKPIAGLSNASCGLNGEQGIEEEMLRRINAFRAQERFCGSSFYPATTPLNWNLALLRASHLHSLQMAQANLVSHVSVDSRELIERVRPTGYLIDRLGENVAAGQTTVDMTMNAWENSPSHCANLMSPIYKDVAVACIYNKVAFYRFYWTMDLGVQREIQPKVLVEVPKEKQPSRKDIYKSVRDPHDFK